MTAQFTIHGLEAGSDILGMWQVVPHPVSFSASFSTMGAAETVDNAPPPIVWSVSLPANPLEAEQTLRKQAQDLRSAQKAINETGQLLEKLSPSQAMASFSASQMGQPPDPQARLLNSLACLQGEETTLAFSLASVSRLPRLPDGWQAIINEYQQFVRQLFQLMQPTLRIETKIESVLLAYTLVRLSGNFETLWTETESAELNRSVEKQQLHGRILSLTIQSRLALLQLLAQTSAGAAALAARFSIPGGAIIALPAVWRYIQDVVKQAQQLAALRDLQKAQ